MYIRDFTDSRKWCIYKQGRNDHESREYIKKKEVLHEILMIAGATGSGKSVFANTLVNEIHEQGDYTAIYVTDKETDELANASHVFKPNEKEFYHINMLDEQNQDVKTVPAKIYHPFTFNIPHRKKLHPVNFFTYNLKEVSKEAIKSIIPSDSEQIIDITLDILKHLKEDESFYDFLWKLYLNREEKEGEIDYDPEELFIPSEQSTSKTTLKNLKLAFKPFRDNLFLMPENSPYNLDFVKLCNDSTHFHHLTHKWITDKKLKLFSIINFLNGIDKALASGLVKKKLVIVFEEVKILFPSGELDKGTTELLMLIYALLSRIRTKAFVICTGQSIFDINWKIRGLFSKTFLGKINKNDIRIMIKDFGLRSLDYKKLISLKIGEFVAWEQIEETDEEQLTAKCVIDIPPFANAELGFEFFAEYAKQFPENCVTHEQVYKEMSDYRDVVEKKRMAELKAFENEKSVRKESKELRSEGKNEEATEKLKELKREKVEIIMQQVYELKTENPDMSWRSIAKKVKGLKSHLTAKKYYEDYLKLLEQKKDEPKPKPIQTFEEVKDDSEPESDWEDGEVPDDTEVEVVEDEKPIPANTMTIGHLLEPVKVKQALTVDGFEDICSHCGKVKPNDGEIDCYMCRIAKESQAGG